MRNRGIPNNILYWTSKYLKESESRSESCDVSTIFDTSHLNVSLHNWIYASFYMVGESYQKTR